MNLCVYGSSYDTIDPEYIRQTELLGEELAKRGHTMVYGGGARGLMGAAARGMKRGGGHIIGIAPSFFDVDGELFADCDEMIMPETMSERKQLFLEKADAFLVLPGGIGTMDEFFETIVLKSFSLQKKPIVFYNIKGYFDKLQEMLEYGVEEGFISPRGLSLYSMFRTPEELIIYLEVRSRL